MTAKHFLAKQIALITMGAALLPVSVSAAESDADTWALEEIIVTAQKRQEGLQDIGQSVQAITAEGMDKAGLTDISRLELIGAGISYGTYGNDAKIAIRGTNSNNTYGDNASVVGLFVDGVYKPRASQQTRAFYDVERLEVLKGPQGTLYGRNTFGGAINLHTNRPDLEEQSGELEVTAARFGVVRTEGVLNIPVSDTFALRVAGLTERSDGWIENSAGKDLGIDDNVSLRVSALWQPSENLEVLARVSSAEEKGTFVGLFSTAGICRPVTANGLTDLYGEFLDCQNPRNGAGLSEVSYATQGFYDIEYDYVENGDLTEDNVTIEVNWDLDGMAFKSISSYTDFKMDAAGDIDYSGQPFSRGSATDYAESWTQEFTLVSTDDGALQWTAGMYFSHDETQYGYYQYSHTAHDNNRIQVPDDNGVLHTVQSGTPIVDTTTVYGSRYAEELRTETDVFGVFGQVEYSLTDEFRVIAGLRYNSEDKEAVGGSSNYSGLPDFEKFVTFVPPSPTAPLAGSPTDLYVFNYSSGVDRVFPEKKYTDTTWRFGLEYDINEEMMAYVSGSTGFLSGALSHNGNITDPQESESWELGLKSRFWDDRLQVNLAAYHTEYTNLLTSIQTEIPGGGVTTTSVNGGDIEADGFEIELLVLPIEGMQIAFNAAWVDAEYGKFGSSNPYQLQNGVVNNFVNLAGERAPFTPEFSFNLSALYDIELGDYGVLTPSIQVAYSDDYSNHGFNLPNTPGGVQDSYSKTDFRLTWISPEESFAIEAFIENIEDEEVTARSTTGGNDRLQTTPLYPQNYGLKLKYSF
ncbi:TonB-dependent receptor [Pseudomaricurvus alkylphenolicus]|uniref:TonB-dependent receptor n=1 Tax=Pseudomaricurvus alkylphenolicus TaxID=1306991 RepID=UPI00142450C1|nr:TonB-dependent receptor [Pseudomaricurvus alkylphenolicus]NIB40643.1 TonB-dependent receptor [Pseudomaricurvus alkylphenolicus]